MCGKFIGAAPAYPMAGQGGAAADGVAADVPGDAPAPRPRKRSRAAATDDVPKVDLTSLDLLEACFEWELAWFLAQAWTRYDLTDSKTRAAMCHCTFLFNCLAAPGIGRESVV